MAKFKVTNIKWDKRFNLPTTTEVEVKDDEVSNMELLVERIKRLISPSKYIEPISFSIERIKPIQEQIFRHNDRQLNKGKFEWNGLRFVYAYDYGTNEGYYEVYGDNGWLGDISNDIFTDEDELDVVRIKDELYNNEIFL